MKTLIVIPAYNEADTIEEVVTGALQYSDVCVVDDASKDSTPEILKSIQEKSTGHSLHVIRHEKNTHIPGGIQDGMKYALSQDYDYVITMDAGMSHLPYDLPAFLEAGAFDVVIGRRHEVENVPLYRKAISWKAARIMNYCLTDNLFDLKGPGIKDCTSGFRRYSKKIYSKIAEAKLESKSFDFHMEALHIAVKNGASQKEIPITYKFSNSSFNRRVLFQAMFFARHLYRKKLHLPDSDSRQPGKLQRIQNTLYKPLRIFACPVCAVVLFTLLYGAVTYFHIQKYEMNYSSMVRFGIEFANANPEYLPPNAVVFEGTEGDLGAGYDGQIFYYYSRAVSKGLDWPAGIDASYRAPRIGYPALISLFGFFGPNAALFGMFFLNITLMVLSYFALRSLLGSNDYLAVFYLISPFALGSYHLLVSDAVMVSLIVIAYWAYRKEKMVLFWVLASLGIITKEPAVFLLFPLGLYELIRFDLRKAAIVLATLMIPVIWQVYLRYTIPFWSASRLSDFILPFDGMWHYIIEIQTALANPDSSLKDIARTLSRLPLLVLFVTGLITAVSGHWRKGFAPRLGLLLSLFMVFVAGHYHFWSVYDNVSRMFTISVALVLLLKARDHTVIDLPFHAVSLAILAVYIVRVIWVTPVMPYVIR